MTEAERHALILAADSPAVAAWALHGTTAAPVPRLAPLTPEPAEIVLERAREALG